MTQGEKAKRCPLTCTCMLWYNTPKRDGVERQIHRDKQRDNKNTINVNVFKETLLKKENTTKAYYIFIVGNQGQLQCSLCDL